MIKTLLIKNIALVENLEIELGDKLNILSGETGAGKSIIIDSLNFVLGERADKGLIRHNTNFATVEAVFEEFLTDEVQSFLDEHGIDIEEYLILKRKMSVDGKNECRINGRIANLSTLRELSDLLVDIHGQHEHQALLKVQNHIHLLDTLGGADLQDLKHNVAESYAKFKSANDEINSFGNQLQRMQRLEILDYQIDEIEKADVKDGEETELLEKRKKIRNLERILSQLNTAKDLLNGYESTAVVTNIKNSLSALSSVSNFDTKIEDLEERLLSLKIEAQDIAETVGDILDDLEFDAHQANKVEERLEVVRAIQRKYGGNYPALKEFYDNAVEEYDRLKNADARVEKLTKILHECTDNLIKSASKLSKMRRAVADKFEKSITEQLSDLGMAGSTFSVSIATSNDADKIGQNGGDSVEFLISPNIGEPLKPLHKIISGGEMSRFMLALKNIVAGIDNIGTMVFDEIDTGISGNISQVVSEKMCNISRNRQVVAVTHMPSLAVMADSHYFIHKHTVDGQTHTQVTLLDDNKNEIARLIGGSDYSTHALPHAIEMQQWAKKYKDSIKK